MLGCPSIRIATWKAERMTLIQQLTINGDEVGAGPRVPGPAYERF